MKQVKTKGGPMGVLYVEMCERVRSANLRLQGVAAQGNLAAMLTEARTLHAQCAALVELLEARDTTNHVTDI